MKTNENSISRTEATLKGIEDMRGEIGAWEMRLMGIKNEVANLSKQKEVAIKDAENRLALIQQEADKAIAKKREESILVEESSRKLRADQEDFNRVLLSFRKEKDDFEDIKKDALDTKANYAEMTEKVGQFVVMVKRGAEKL
jgi:hypothetical protein